MESARSSSQDKRLDIFNINSSIEISKYKASKLVGILGLNSYEKCLLLSDNVIGLGAILVSYESIPFILINSKYHHLSDYYMYLNRGIDTQIYFLAPIGQVYTSGRMDILINSINVKIDYITRVNKIWLDIVSI